MKTREAGPFIRTFCTLWVSLGCSGSTFRCVGVDLVSFGRCSLCRGHVRHYSACAVSPHSHSFGPRQITLSLTPVISLLPHLTPILTQRTRLLGFGALRLDFQCRKGRLDCKTPNNFAHERHAGSALRRPNGIDVLIRDMILPEVWLLQLVENSKCQGRDENPRRSSRSCAGSGAGASRCGHAIHSRIRRRRRHRSGQSRDPITRSRKTNRSFTLRRGVGRQVRPKPLRSGPRPRQ